MDRVGVEECSFPVGSPDPVEEQDQSVEHRSQAGEDRSKTDGGSKT